MTQIPIQIDLGEDILKQAIAVQMISGELGDKIAVKLAEMQAEIMTFTRTETAQLLNKSRATVYQLEGDGKLKFHNNTISLKALLDYRRAEETDVPKEIERHQTKPKRRTFR